MSKKVIISQENQKIIRDEYPVLSIKELSALTGSREHTIRKFLKIKGLHLTRSKAQELRYDRMRENDIPLRKEQEDPEKSDYLIKTPWVRDPWEHGLNLITMQVPITIKI